MTSRRRFLASASAAAAGCGRAKDRPNILFVIADDMSWPHAGAYGDAVVRTPNFDRVARDGALFNRSYCASPSCTPSRTAVLTGRPIWATGQGGVLYGTLEPKYPLVTHVLEDDGYHVGFTGKGWAPGDWRAGGLTRHPNGVEYNAIRHAGPVRGGIDVRDYAANFQKFLDERPQNKPFFFWFGCTEPHRVYEKGSGIAMGKKPESVRVSAYWPDTLEVRSDILDYYAEIEWFDQQLGRVLEALDRSGQASNTMVVVTSDNGMPFPRAKVNLYEAGIHMPLAIRWPGRFSGGRVVDSFASHTDFAATFLAAARIKPPESVTGMNLLPVIDGNDPANRGREYVEAALERHTYCRPGGATYPMRAIRDRQWLCIWNAESDRWPTGGEFISSNRTPHGDVDACPTKDFMTEPGNRARFAVQYEACFGRRAGVELYDVATDPDQMRNLAEDQPEQTLRLLKLLDPDDPRQHGQDPWQAYPYRQTTGFGASFNATLSDDERRQARERASHKPE